MTFDRRGLDRHVPLARQADDALVALATLRARLPDVPVGVWGFSQGAWVALMAVDRTPSEVAFLVLVGFCAVSPGAQMRHLAGRAVRRAGYGDHDIAAVTELRRSFEAFTRGDLPLEDAQALVDEATVRPWFDLTYIPSQLRTPADPALFDHDPAPGIASLRCPVLLFYGEDDQDVPVEESLRIWREQATAPTTIVSLPGVGHVLTAGEVADAAALPPECATRLGAWVGEQCRRGPTPAPM